MDPITRRQINSCISEIEAIISEIRKVSVDVPENAKGIDTSRFQRELANTIRRYERAADNLRKLR